MTVRIVLFLASVFLIISPPTVLLAADWYADGSVDSSGDGATWATAFKTIQEGIDVASDGDTVIVAEGTYVENIYFYGKNIVLTSTDPLGPDVVATTIVDGNKLGSVVTFDGTETEACVLSGFTIQNGETLGDGGGIRGGSMYHTHATIRHNVITGNQCIYGDGRVYACDGLIEGNTITENSANLGGGGLAHCNGTIQNNTISGNTAGQCGGLYDCDGTIQNNTITGNHGARRDAGLNDCRGTIVNCIVWGNGLKPELVDCSLPTYSCIENWGGGGEGNMLNTWKRPAGRHHCNDLHR